VRRCGSNPKIAENYASSRTVKLDWPRPEAQSVPWRDLLRTRPEPRDDSASNQTPREWHEDHRDGVLEHGAEDVNQCVRAPVRSPAWLARSIRLPRDCRQYYDGRT